LKIEIKNQIECKIIVGYMIVTMIIVVMINDFNKNNYLNVNRYNLLNEEPLILKTTLR